MSEETEKQTTTHELTVETDAVIEVGDTMFVSFGDVAALPAGSVITLTIRIGGEPAPVAPAPEPEQKRYVGMRRP